MPLYNIEVIETYKYKIEIEANTSKEALKNAKKVYAGNEVEGVFVADATTIEKTIFKVRNDFGN